MRDYKHIDGKTSSFLPGENGNRGRRARLTFISSYSEGISTNDFLLQQYELSGDTFKHDDVRDIGNSIDKLSYYYKDDAGYPKYTIDTNYPENLKNYSGNTTYNSDNQYKYQDNVTNPPIGNHSVDCSYAPFDASASTDDVNNYWSTINDKEFDIDLDGSFNDKLNTSNYKNNTQDLPLGNIIKEENISSLPLDDDAFVGYKFYETTQVNTDSSIGYIATIPNSYMSIIVPEFNMTPKVIKRLPEYPEPYDYIIYVDKNETYLLLIEEILEGHFFEPIPCKCKILDVWKRSKNIATHIDNTSELTDNIKLYCVNQSIKRVVLDNTENINALKSEYNNDYITPITKTIKDETLLKNFLITSSKNKLGDYKITAEFMYTKEYTLPVHTIIAERFTEDGNTLIGNPLSFDRNGSLPQNFDDEKLDTFEIIIKDFKDGLNNSTFSSSVKVYIPEIRQDLYTVNIFMYYKKRNGGYNKFLLNSMPYKQFIVWDDIINKKYK